VDIAILVELFNPQTNSWTLVQTIQTGSSDYHFGGTSARFPAISQVNKIRFTASQPVFAAFHFYEMSINLNSINMVQLTGLPSGSVFPVGSTMNSFRAIDLAGNVAVSSFTVTILDKEKPRIENVTGSIQYVTTGCSWFGNGGSFRLRDNCSGSLRLTEQYFDDKGNKFLPDLQFILPQSNFLLGARTFPIGVNTVKLLLTDAAGNVSDMVSFTVKVIDNLNPTIVIAGNLTQNSDPGSCGAYVQVPVPVTNDNCSVQSVVNNITGGPGASGRYPVGTTILTWTVTDGSGNITTTTQSITVTDNEPPVIINVPVSLIQTNDAGTCGAVVTWDAVRATDNCGLISFISDHQPGETFPLGETTVMFTATDRNNNIATASFTITVTDNEAPRVITRPVTVTLVNGTASILPSAINNGSSDNCGAITLSASKTTFTCADAGINTVTLTVTDAQGNASGATALVTVIGQVPTPTIQVIPSGTVYTGGVPTNIYIGYGPQSVTLTANVVGNTPVTYLWTGNGNLSCTNCASPTFTPNAAGTYTFTVKTTNQYGCMATSFVSICVRDIRVTPVANSRVFVCHTDLTTGATQTLSLAVNAVANQLLLNPQDLLGSCGMLPCSSAATQSIVIVPVTPVTEQQTQNSKEQKGITAVEAMTVKVLPNPSNTVFTFMISTNRKAPIHVRLFDAAGRLAEGLNNAPVSTRFTMGSKLTSGTYFAEVIQGNERVVVRLIKQIR